ncbi:MAG: hypothetical protein IJV16_04045 [Lachnospiraceae bacterium]|nr:hypothetical protein [Lachnospiraceae bacterium]
MRRRECRSCRFNRLLTDKEEIIANMEMLKEGVSDTEGLADEMGSEKRLMGIAMISVRRFIRLF